MEEQIIYAYKKGKSLNAIAKHFGMHPTSVSRLLEKNGVELRHDPIKKGRFFITGGEKLIKWAKAQGRLVTKAELAKVLGKKTLSPSYFIKYPELGRYVQDRTQKDLQEYGQKLYKWLRVNKIPYKPNDKTKLGKMVSALLLKDYTGLAIQIDIKAPNISNPKFQQRRRDLYNCAKKNNIQIIWLRAKHFKDLDQIHVLLDKFKRGEPIDE